MLKILYEILLFVGSQYQVQNSARNTPLRSGVESSLVTRNRNSDSAPFQSRSQTREIFEALELERAESESGLRSGDTMHTLQHRQTCTRQRYKLVVSTCLPFTINFTKIDMANDSFTKKNVSKRKREEICYKNLKI